MDERAQTRVLWLLLGMFAGYAGSAACFALAFVTGRRWVLVLALSTAAVGIVLSTLIRPVLLGYARWWRDAPGWRRGLNVLLLIARVVAVVAVAWGALTFMPR